MNTPLASGRTVRKIARISGALAIFFATLLTAACTNNPIFASIETEVKLKTPTVQGTVYSMVSVGGDLYTTNGRIYKRTGGAGAWNTIAMPNSSTGLYRCSQLATDGTATHLYALFTNQDWTAFNSVQMFDVSTSTWTLLTVPASMVKIESGAGKIFGFAPDTPGVYNAYVATGTSFTATAIATTLAAPVDTTGNPDYFATTGGLYTSAGAAVPLTPTSLAGMTTDGTNIFVVNIYGTVVSWNGTAWNATTQTAPITTPATCIAYLPGTGKNILLVGGGLGYGEVLTDGAGNLTNAQAPGASAQSSITYSTSAQSQYYNTLGLWNLNSIFAFTSPLTPSTDSYVVYAGVIDSKYDGLWAYYATSQTEWNRE